MTPHRTMFWQIENAWVFYLLAGIATLLFLLGLSAYIFSLEKKRRFPYRII